RAAYVGGPGEPNWRFSLPDSMQAFGTLPGEGPAVSSDRGLWACVAVGPGGRHIAMASMRSSMARVLKKPLAEVRGLSWSPDGTTLCVLAGDAAVGVISVSNTVVSDPPATYSLFTVKTDGEDLVALAGPIAAVGMPRWSPTGDAVAIVEPQRGGRMTTALVMLDGNVRQVLAGSWVVLGDTAWAPDGRLLCAVRDGDGEVVPSLIDLQGGVHRLSGDWQEVSTLTLAGDGSVIVSGRRNDSWCVARVAENSIDVIVSLASAAFPAVVASDRLWFVAATGNGEPGLWTCDLTGHAAQLRLTAPSMRDLHVRADGVAAAVMAGDVEREDVCVLSAQGGTIHRVGRREAIWGWAGEQTSQERDRARLWHSRRPR
ncbi:MAG TPA: hypothetical protein VN478_04500, partial [Clostridia bacterium]|nr:hypothetical protein [Clostridia bacterium]